MSAVKTLDIFGEKVEVYVTGEMTGGSVAVCVQVTAPGGGPPPHMHTREDETFCVLEGSFEFLDHGTWRPLTVGVPAFAPRNVVHTFRNAGTTTGRILFAASPAGLEVFFEHLAGLSPATDMPRILELFAQYGLSLA